jgi:hypothetical protein
MLEALGELCGKPRPDLERSALVGCRHKALFFLQNQDMKKPSAPTIGLRWAVSLEGLEPFERAKRALLGGPLENRISRTQARWFTS